MDVEFDLVLTDSQGQPVKWQDGTAVSVNDVKFAWDFLSNWAIPKFWGAMQFYDSANTVIVDVDTIRARMTLQSQWLMYNLAGLAYYVPPQIWTNNPVTTNPWANTAEILGFDPSAHAGPGGLPTMLFGTGAFILQHSTTFIGTQGYGDLEANRNYFKTTQDVQDDIEYMFWRAGDVDTNGVIEAVGDLDFIGVNWNPGYHVDADITGQAGNPPDSVVDLFDFTQCAKFFAETRTVPFP